MVKVLVADASFDKCFLKNEERKAMKPLTSLA